MARNNLRRLPLVVLALLMESSAFAASFMSRMTAHYRTAQNASPQSSGLAKSCLEVRWSLSTPFPFWECDAVPESTLDGYAPSDSLPYSMPLCSVLGAPLGVLGYAIVAGGRDVVVSSSCSGIGLCTDYRPSQLRLHALLGSPFGSSPILSNESVALVPEPANTTVPTVGGPSASASDWLPYGHSSSVLASIGGLTGAIAAFSGKKFNLVNWGSDPLALTNGLWPPRAAWSSVDAEHGGFVLANGALAAWSASNSPFIGPASNLAPVLTAGPVAAVAAGRPPYAAVLLRNGYISTVAASFNDQKVTLVDGTLQVDATGGVTAMGATANTVALVRAGQLRDTRGVVLNNVTDMGCGLYSCCARVIDGTVACWGPFMDSSSNFTTENTSPLPIGGMLPSSAALSSLSGGDQAACVLVPNGAADADPTADWGFPPSSPYCWGNGYLGRVPSSPRTAISHGPAPVTGVRDAVALGCRNPTACVAIADGGNALYSWGTPLHTAFPLESSSLLPRRLPDPENVLSRLNSLPGRKRLQCTLMGCCVASALGLHCMGAGMGAVLRPSGRLFVPASSPQMVFDSQVSSATGVVAAEGAGSRGGWFTVVRNGTVMQRGISGRTASPGIVGSSTVWKPLLPAGLAATSVSWSYSAAVILFHDGSARAYYTSSANTIRLARRIVSAASRSVVWDRFWTFFVLDDGSAFVCGQYPISFSGVAITNYASQTCASPLKLQVADAAGPVCFGGTDGYQPFACLVLRNGSVSCAGLAMQKLGYLSYSVHWLVLPGFTGVLQLACGGDLLCALPRDLADGIKCVGRADSGLAGTGVSTVTLAVPTALQFPESFTSVSFGDRLQPAVAAAVGQSGTVYTWGLDAGSLVPVPVNIPVPCANVTCGTNNCVAIARNGSLWFWGHDRDLLSQDPPAEMTEPNPNFSAMASRSAPSLLASLPSMRFSPTRHLNAAAALQSSTTASSGDSGVTGPLHHCLVPSRLRRLVEGAPESIDSVLSGPGTDPKQAFACAANATAVACWGVLPFDGSSSYNVSFEREGAGASRTEAVSSFNRPLLPATVSFLSLANARPLPIRASISGLHCSAAGVAVIVAGGAAPVRVVSGGCAAALPALGGAAYGAGVSVYVPPVQGPASSAPVLLLTLQSTVSAPTEEPAGAIRSSRVLLAAQVLSNATSGCLFAGTVEIPLLDESTMAGAGASMWRVTAFAVIYPHSDATDASATLCGAAQVQSSGRSLLACGPMPTADAVRAAVSGPVIQTPPAPSLLPVSNTVAGTFSAAVVQLAGSPRFGICVLLADGRLSCQSDGSSSRLFEAKADSRSGSWVRLFSFATSFTAASGAGAAHICVTTTSMVVLCFGNNTRGEAGRFGMLWTGDSGQWVSPDSAREVPGLSLSPAGLDANGDSIETTPPPPLRPRWHTVTILSSSCTGSAVYTGASFVLHGCPLAPASGMLHLNFTGGGAFPAGTMLHLHWTSANYTSALLRCSYASTIGPGLPHWCVANIPLPPLSERGAVAAMHAGLTLHTSYELPTTANGSVPLRFRSCEPDDSAASPALASCIDRSNDAPLFVFIRSRLSLAPDGWPPPSSSARACREVWGNCPIELPQPTWNSSTGVLRGLSAAHYNRIRSELTAPLPELLEGPIFAWIDRAVATSTSGNASAHGRIACTDVSPLSGGQGFDCTLPPFLGGGYRLFASHCPSCNTGDEAGPLVTVLAGSEMVQAATEVWAVEQPKPTLPSQGLLEPRARLHGVFTSLNLSAPPLLWWRYPEACGNETLVLTEGRLEGRNLITTSLPPGFAELRLSSIELDGWRSTVDCNGQLPCTLTYAPPSLTTVSAVFSSAARAYSVRLLGSGLGSLTCTPLYLEVDGTVVGRATSLGSDTEAVFSEPGVLFQAISQVRVLSAGRLQASNVKSEVAIDSGCSPFALCGVGLTEYGSGGVALVVWQEGTLPGGLTPAALAPSVTGVPRELVVYKRAGAPLWPPIRIAAMDIRSISANTTAIPPAISASYLSRWETITNIVREDRTRCILTAPQSAANSSYTPTLTSRVTLSASDTRGTEVPLPLSLSDVAASTSEGVLLSLVCNRDGALSLTLPPVRVRTLPLEVMTVASSFSRYDKLTSSGLAFLGDEVPYAVVKPPLGLVFPLPPLTLAALVPSPRGDVMAGLPMSQPPCRLLSTETVLWSPVEEPSITLGSMTFDDGLPADIPNPDPTGILTARLFEVTALPGTEVNISLQCFPDINWNALGRPQPSSAAAFSVQVISCTAGETVALPSMTCSRCNNGSFSLVPAPNTHPWHVCVPCGDADKTATEKAVTTRAGLASLPPASGLICATGGHHAVARPGWWRSSNTSLVAVPCTVPEACDEATTGAGACSMGYSGRACSRCAMGFGRVGAICVPCPAGGSGGFVALVLLLLFVGTMLLTCWARAAAVKETEVGQKPAPNATPSGLTKAIAGPRLLLDHAQMLQVAATLRLVWPPAVVAFFSGIAVVSSTADAGFVVQWECVVAEHVGASSVSSAFLATQAVVLALPFVLLGMAVVAVGAWALFSVHCGRTSRTPEESKPPVQTTGAAGAWRRLCPGAASQVSTFVRAVRPSAAVGALAMAGAHARDADSANSQHARKAAIWVWFVETIAAAVIALSYILHTTLTQRLALMLACSEVEDARIIALPENLMRASLTLRNASFLDDLEQAARRIPEARAIAAIRPSWANITSLELSGGAWLVTEKASYAVADPSLLCDDRRLWAELVPAFSVVVIGIPMLMLASLLGWTARPAFSTTIAQDALGRERVSWWCHPWLAVCRFFNTFGNGLASAARGSMAREMRPGWAAWPVMGMVRKMALTFIVVVLAPSGAAAQLAAGILVLAISLASHMEVRPAADADMNRLTAASMLAVTCSFAVGLFVTIPGASASVQQASSVAIVAGNILFAITVAAYASNLSACCRRRCSCLFNLGKSPAAAPTKIEVQPAGDCARQQAAPAVKRVLLPFASDRALHIPTAENRSITLSSASKQLQGDLRTTFSDSASFSTAFVNPLNAVVAPRRAAAKNSVKPASSAPDASLRALPFAPVATAGPT